jgi:hypothetical protein
MLEGPLWGSTLSIRTERLKIEILLDQYGKICNIFSEKTKYFGHILFIYHRRSWLYYHVPDLDSRVPGSNLNIVTVYLA